MSKKGRKCRAWHYRRIQAEFDEKPETIICEMFAEGLAIETIAGALGISYGEMHEWIKELGLTRPPIKRCSRHPVKERIRREFRFDAVRLICSDRAMGATYEELRNRYDVSSGFIANCLHKGAPHLIGDTVEQYQTHRPERVSREGRLARTKNARRHNAQMKMANRGWFADMFGMKHE